MDIPHQKISDLPSTKKPSSKNLADQLRKEKNNILEHWEKIVRRDIAASHQLKTSDLKNSLPSFLENLAFTFEGENRTFEAKVAREHGRERATFPHYTLEQIITEYRILRKIVFSVLGELSPQDRDSIIDAIELGITEAASEFAQQQYQLREKFVSMLAHDLRNPLTVAKTSAQLILRNPEKIESIQVMASRIVDTIDRTDRMIKDLLDSNLSQMGQKLGLKIEASDLRSLAKMILEEATSMYGNYFVLEADVSIVGYWDPTLLQRAIGNLLSNAVKYGSPENPIKITIAQEEARVKKLILP
jgi:signal transduction histidine kinase